MDVLPLAWAGLVAFYIVMYVILDGFTLGTAILLPTMNREQRDLAVSVILPTWDGNQTWLVLGGASLYGAFPLAFSLLMPVLYLPIFAMLIALLLRGVVFEFRLKDKDHVRYWDKIFTASSIAVTFIQGCVLANFVQGFEYSTKPFIASSSALITPFSFFVSLSLICGYCLLGATRLIYKTEGELQKKMTKVSFYMAFLVMIALGVVSLWTPWKNALIFERWFGHQHWLLLMILPYLAFLTFIVLVFALKKKEEHIPFFCSVALFIYAYIGFIICLYPYIIPYKITFMEAAAPNNSLYFMMFGAVIMLPILILYTGYAYQVFKGKVKNVFHY